MVGQLMLASYRSGRQDEAVRAYARLRVHLAEEFGLDPGPQVRRLFTLVLRGDPTLDLKITPAAVPIPRQLPAEARGFAGRTRSLAELDAALLDADQGGVPIVAISGMGGVGKTALTVHWAHRLAEGFPDGQLYANLHGFAASPPVPPEQVLAQFLRALGVPADDVPADSEEAGRLFRTILASRRLLVVLDNVAHADQAR